jgi:hypothetical protein
VQVGVKPPDYISLVFVRSVVMLSLLLATTLLVPGEIFGDVRVGETFVADADVKLTCGAEVATGKTDKSGSFRIKSKSNGKCSVAITYQGQSPSVDIVVFERPTRYRLVLEQKDGKYTLKRV